MSKVKGEIGFETIVWITISTVTLVLFLFMFNSCQKEAERDAAAQACLSSVIIREQTKLPGGIYKPFPLACYTFESKLTIKNKESLQKELAEKTALCKRQFWDGRKPDALNSAPIFVGSGNGCIVCEHIELKGTPKISTTEFEEFMQNNDYKKGISYDKYIKAGVSEARLIIMEEDGSVFKDGKYSIAFQSRVEDSIINILGRIGLHTTIYISTYGLYHTYQGVKFLITPSASINANMQNALEDRTVNKIIIGPSNIIDGQCEVT